MYRTQITSTPSPQDRFAALVAHGGTFVAWFLAPILVFLLKREESRYAEFHALQSLLWSLSGAVIASLTCGLAIPVFMVFHGIATYRILTGRDYEYPVVGEIARTLMRDGGTSLA
jgi:uncharacterized membrane protein